jgi:hypothetical protein
VVNLLQILVCKGDQRELIGTRRGVVLSYNTYSLYSENKNKNSRKN